MPHLAHIAIHNFRNIRSATVVPSDSVNIIYGANGSGKTSFLESANVLAHGRSFRTHKFQKLISEGQPEFTLAARVRESQHLETSVGISKSVNGVTRIRVNGENARSSAELAANLPLLVMNTQSYRLLDGSPSERRGFLDWLVFHVKHEFMAVWRSYAKCLKHRNSLLRHGKIAYSDVEPWDQQLAVHGRALDAMRDEVFQSLNSVIVGTLATEFSFSNANDVAFSLRSGWLKSERSLEEQLEESFSRDIRLGYTHIGCHKYDIKVSCGSHLAIDRLSRGQQKLLITGMYIAVAKVFKSFCGRSPVYMLDDLTAELDSTNIGVMSKLINELGSQVFITCVDPKPVLENWSSSTDRLRMFHVEHGEISEKTIS